MQSLVTPRRLVTASAMACLASISICWSLPAFAAVANPRVQSVSEGTPRPPLLFIAVAFGSVEIFSQRTKRMVGTALVGVEPQGVAVNSQGDLYSASFQDYPCPGSATGAWITPRPWQKGSLCLPTGGYPIGVAVARDGVVAVMVKGSSAADYIVFFRPKSATPCSTITGASFPVLTGRGAFDRHGNLYVTGYGPGGSVGEAVGQCKARTVKDVGIASLPNATGIRVDTAGNIGVLWNSDSFENAVNVYQPGSTSPSQTIELNGLYEATDFVFVEGGRNIWVTDWLDRNTGGSEAYKYAYPGGGSPVGPGVFSSRSTFNSIAALPIVQPGGAQ